MKINQTPTLLRFKTSMQAWEDLNRVFLFNKEDLDIQRIGKAQYINDLVIVIEKPLVDPEFDFGRHFNYTKAKWRSLVANYINKEELANLKSEIQNTKKSGIYNLAYQFDNNHKHGKNCLLSMVVSSKAGYDYPMITLFMRASEVTKRLICDLLLIQRIGEYLFDGSKFHICIHFNQIFNDDTVLLMYHAHEDIIKLCNNRYPNMINPDVLDRLKYLLKVDPKDIKYKVHKRALKVLRPEIYKYPVTLAKDSVL